MKIAIITPGGFDRTGDERVIPVFLWLVERLARNHEVHVYTLYQGPEPDDFPLLGAMVHNVGHVGKPLPAARLAARTLQRIRREHARAPFDVLHGLWASESGLIAALIARRLHIPSVVTVAGGELTALPAIGYGTQLRWKGRVTVRLTLRLATAVTTAAEYTRRPLLRLRPDAHKIYLGADTCRFQPDEVPPSSPRRLLHVASLNRVKDQPTLLHAMQRIHAEMPSARLDILGVDTLGGEIQRLASRLGLDGCVQFHGILPSHQVAERLRKCHLLLHTSVFESGPLVFLEAAACGVPTVGTSVGLLDDLAGDVCQAVPVGSSGELAREAVGLLRDEEARQCLGAKALAWARRYNADWTASQFEALYRQVRDRDR